MTPIKVMIEFDGQLDDFTESEGHGYPLVQHNIRQFP